MLGFTAPYGKTVQHGLSTIAVVRRFEDTISKLVMSLGVRLEYLRAVITPSVGGESQGETQFNKRNDIAQHWPYCWE